MNLKTKAAKFTVATTLFAALLINLFLVNIQTANAVTPSQVASINYATLTYPSIANNAAAVLIPIIQKAGASTTTPVATDLKTSFAFSLANTVQGKSYNYSAGINTQSQNIYNAITHNLETNQTGGTFSYSLDPKLASSIGAALLNGSISFQVKYFTSTKGVDYYFNITSMPASMLAAINKYTDSGNQLKLNTWYKLSSSNSSALLKSSQAAKNSDYEMYASKLLFSNVTLDKDFGVENLAIGSARHVKLGFTPEGVKNFVTNALAISSMQKSESLDQQLLATAMQALSSKEAQQLISGIKVDLWVGTNDARIYKLAITGTNLTFTQVVPGYTGAQTATTINNTINVSLSTEAQSVNVVASIVPPKNFIDLNKVIEATTAKAKIAGQKANIQANVSSARAQAEIYYSNANNSYSGVCTSGQYSLKGITSSIKANVPGTVVSCKSTASKYVYSAKLANKSYFCVDNTGNTAVTTTDRAAGKLYTCE